MTQVVVTHDIHSAKIFSDRMLLLREGELVIEGTIACNGLENLDKKLAFLKWCAALRMKESQCPERARVTHPA